MRRHHGTPPHRRAARLLLPLVGVLALACGGGAGMGGERAAARDSGADEPERAASAPAEAIEAPAPVESPAPPAAAADRPVLAELAASTGSDGIARVDVPTAHRLWQAGDVVLVDVRSAEAYRDAHPPGALSAPLGDVSAANLPADPDTPILAYCT